LGTFEGDKAIWLGSDGLPVLHRDTSTLLGNPIGSERIPLEKVSELSKDELRHVYICGNSAYRLSSNVCSYISEAIRTLHERAEVIESLCKVGKQKHNQEYEEGHEQFLVEHLDEGNIVGYWTE
jgi:hypothetical protein